MTRKEYQKKYLNAYGFNKNKMPSNFDEWFNNLWSKDKYEIIKKQLKGRKYKVNYLHSSPFLFTFVV